MNKILSFNFTNMTAGISDPFECKKKLTYILIFSVELDNSLVKCQFYPLTLGILIDLCIFKGIVYIHLYAT